MFQFDSRIAHFFNIENIYNAKSVTFQHRYTTISMKQQDEFSFLLRPFITVSLKTGGTVCTTSQDFV